LNDTKKKGHKHQTGLHLLPDSASFNAL